MTVGERFARALAAKDAVRLHAVLAPEVDFKGLTPNRVWEASSATAVVEDVILGHWFEPTDTIEELERVEADSVGDRQRIGYRLRVTNPSGTYLVEQQAYYAVEGDRITWLRVLCSGFRPADAVSSG